MMMQDSKCAKTLGILIGVSFYYELNTINWKVFDSLISLFGRMVIWGKILFLDLIVDLT